MPADTRCPGGPYPTEMIRHTVAFTLRHDEGSAAERDFLSTGPALLRAIPGVDDFTVCRQISPKSTYRFQFAMTFADEDAYADYNNHPDHQAFVTSRWATEVGEFEELDFVEYEGEGPTPTSA